MLIHEAGPGNIWTGQSREIGASQPIPRKWHSGELPVLASGEYAKWMGGQWAVVTEPYVAPVPRDAMAVTRGRFAVAVAKAAIITEQEAIDWAGGNGLPTLVNAAIGTLPPGDQLAAKVEALTALNVQRLNPLVLMLQAATGLADAQVDALFDA